MAATTGTPILPIINRPDSIILFNTGSTSQYSPNIVVDKFPIVVRAFGLEVGQIIQVYNVYGEGKGDRLEPFFINGAVVELSTIANVITLPFSGRYRLRFQYPLGTLVCTATLQIPFDEAAKKRFFTAPGAKQQMLPNSYFDFNSTSNSSQNISVTDIPWVFRVFDIPEGETVDVYNVFGSGAGTRIQEYWLRGEQVQLTSENNTLTLDLTGRYRFVYSGTPGDILLVGNPMPILYDNPYKDEGEPGPPGPAGNTILSGNGVPSEALGVNGNFYIDLDNPKTIYGPKTAGVWGVGTSLVGPAGPNGSTILNGLVAPTIEGANGDFYIDISTYTIYGPKTAGVWGVGTSLVGPAGTVDNASVNAAISTNVDATREVLLLDISNVFETKIDCAGFPTSIVGQEWRVVMGGSSLITWILPTTLNSAGYWSFIMQTSTTSEPALGSLATAILLGQGETYFRTRLQLGALSDGTDTFSVEIGFIQTVSGSATQNGAFFRYTHSVNSGRWEAVTVDNGAITATDTGITAIAGTDLVMEVYVNAVGSSAEFSINGVIVATNIANIPTASGRRTGYGLRAKRSAGTVAKTAFLLDYAYVRKIFTTPR